MASHILDDFIKPFRCQCFRSLYLHFRQVSHSGGSRKKYLGAWPLIIWEEQRLSEITIEPLKNLGAWARFGEGCAPWPQYRTATGDSISKVYIYTFAKFHSSQKSCFQVLSS